MANLKFRQVGFRNNNPYEGGVCLLDDGTPVWAVIDGNTPNLRLIVQPLRLEDVRPPGPTMFDVVE